jgi:hypothetical protein
VTDHRINIEGWPKHHVAKKMADVRAQAASEGVRVTIENVSGYFLIVRVSA